MNKKRLAELSSQPVEVLLLRVLAPEAELDEMWSFVQSKQQQRWLWQAVDHVTNLATKIMRQACFEITRLEY